jgi:hypothetical protein
MEKVEDQMEEGKRKRKESVRAAQEIRPGKQSIAEVKEEASFKDEKVPNNAEEILN